MGLYFSIKCIFIVIFYRSKRFVMVKNDYILQIYEKYILAIELIYYLIINIGNIVIFSHH